MYGPEHIDRPGDRPGDEELRRVEEYLDAPAGPFDAVPGHPAQGEQNVVSDRFDARTYSELVGASAELGRLASDEGAPGTFPALLKDLFLSFYKAQPDLAPEEEVLRRHRKANRPFVERLLDDPATYDARATTRLDALSSGLASLAAGKRILDEIKDRPDLQRLFEDAEREEPGPDELPDEQPSGPEGEDDETVPPLPQRALRRAVRAAAGDAAREADEVAAALSGWGLAPADLERVPLGERLELVRRLTGPEMRRLVELAGRMRNLARARAREKVTVRRDERRSITTGRDLRRVLPSELARLASKNSLRRKEFACRFLDGKLLSYELKSTERRGRGPVIAAVDCSGSMAGHKMNWATAVALALVDLAAGRHGSSMPKRRSHVLFFNEGVVHEAEFAPGERDPRKLLSVATVGAVGGTEYGPPLDRALEILSASEYAGADVLLVTDAICVLSDDRVEKLLSEKRLRGFSLYSVLIGGGSSAELARYSDEVFPLTDLAGERADEAAGEIFGNFA